MSKVYDNPAQLLLAENKKLEKEIDQLKADKQELVVILGRVTIGLAECLKVLDVYPEEDEDYNEAIELLTKHKEQS